MYENLITKYAIVYGDVDLNGVVNQNDGMRVLRYAAGMTGKNAQISEHGMLNADVNQDGVIDEKDGNIILTYCAELGPRYFPWTEQDYEEWVIPYLYDN